MYGVPAEAVEMAVGWQYEERKSGKEGIYSVSGGVILTDGSI